MDVWQPSNQLAGPAEVAGEIQFPDPPRGVDPDERRDGRIVPADWRSHPSYLFARLPGDGREQFMLATSFTPRGRENLVSYLAGSVDRRGDPRLTAVTLPRDQLTPGPSQATREILASPEVNRRIELLNHAGERMFGYNEQEVIGLKVNILLPEPCRSQHEDYLRHYIEAGEPVAYMLTSPVKASTEAVAA